MSKTAILVSTLTLLAVLAVSFQAGVDSVPAHFESSCPEPQPTVCEENFDEYFDDDAGALDCPEVLECPAPTVCAAPQPAVENLCSAFCTSNEGIRSGSGPVNSSCWCTHSTREYEFLVPVKVLRAQWKARYK